MTALGRALFAGVVDADNEVWHIVAWQAGVDATAGHCHMVADGDLHSLRHQIDGSIALGGVVEVDDGAEIGDSPG
jgi:hypothetical protein